uniref:Protein kinase domain-containing protein n=1 Tax=Ascaris lumbricoides TaxID=6252 RepID=A0A0M3ILQ4_ASCLU
MQKAHIESVMMRHSLLVSTSTAPRLFAQISCLSLTLLQVSLNWTDSIVLLASHSIASFLGSSLITVISMAWEPNQLIEWSIEEQFGYPVIEMNKSSEEKVVVDCLGCFLRLSRREQSSCNENAHLLPFQNGNQHFRGSRFIAAVSLASAAIRGDKKEISSRTLLRNLSLQTTHESNYAGNWKTQKIFKENGRYVRPSESSCF